MEDVDGKITWTKKRYSEGYIVEAFGGLYVRSIRTDLSQVPDEVLEVIFNEVGAERARRNRDERLKKVIADLI